MIGRAVLWWAALAGLFMLFEGEWTAVDWVGAGAAGFLAAGLTAALWRAGLLSYGFRLRWLGSAPKVAKQIPVDFGIVSVALVRAVLTGRREIGAFVARADFPGGDASPTGVGWRAWIAIASTLSPNSYVVDIDAASGARLSHDLVPHRSSERPA